MKNTNAIKVDLNEIAEIRAQGNGFVSEDLKDALKMAQAAGLNAENRPLSDWILTDDRVLNYGQEGDGSIELEADVVLTLRVKAGDSRAFDMLVEAHKAILDRYIRQVMSTYKKSKEESKTLVYGAYYEGVRRTKISYHGLVLKSIAKNQIERYIGRAIKEEAGATENVFTCNRNVLEACNTVRREMSKQNIEVKDLTVDTVRDFMTASNKHNCSPLKVYNVLIGGKVSNDNEANDEFEAIKQHTAEVNMLKNGTLAWNPVEDAVLDRIERQKLMNAIVKLAETEVCVKMYVDYHMSPKGSVSYRDLANTFGLKDEKEVLKYLVSAQRMLVKELQRVDGEAVARIKAQGI